MSEKAQSGVAGYLLFVIRIWWKPHKGNRPASRKAIMLECKENVELWVFQPSCLPTSSLL